MCDGTGEARRVEAPLHLGWHLLPLRQQSARAFAGVQLCTVLRTPWLVMAFWLYVQEVLQDWKSFSVAGRLSLRIGLIRPGD